MTVNYYYFDVLYIMSSSLKLLLCYYLLPAIAAVVKTRTKKLSQINSSSNSTSSLQVSETTILTDNWAYFYAITPNDDNIVTKTIETPAKITQSNYKFNFSTQTNNLIREFKFISFFL